MHVGCQRLVPVKHFRIRSFATDTPHGPIVILRGACNFSTPELANVHRCLLECMKPRGGEPNPNDLAISSWAISRLTIRSCLPSTNWQRHSFFGGVILDSKRTAKTVWSWRNTARMIVCFQTIGSWKSATWHRTRHSNWECVRKDEQ
jgi:hypothetical protein